VKIVESCPWGCGQRRFTGAKDMPQHAVRCGQCKAPIPAPHVEMFAREERKPVEQWLAERAT